jgi:hypothetical protein
MSFEKESENLARRNRSESTESGFESKEKQDEALEKKLGAKERMEQVTHEVKTTKQQMQNIVMNMQQVVSAVAAIRAQLNLKSDTNIPSTEQDQRALEILQKKLQSLSGQLEDLKNALLVEEKRKITEENPGLSQAEVQSRAEDQVSAVLKQLGVE